MDFLETREHAILRKSVSDFMTEFSDDYFREQDRKEEFPRELWNKIAAQGWFGVNVPEKYDGSEFGIYEASVLAHQIAASGAGITGGNLFNIVSMMTVQPIVDHGSERLKSKYLPELASGKLIPCLGLTEPNAGVNTFNLETFAVKESDSYIIHGHKMWTTLAHVADIMIIVARTTPKEKVQRKSDGLSLFVAELNKPLVKIQRISKMPMRALGSNEVFLNNLQVPEENLLGVKDKGWETLLTLLNAERVATAAMCIGTGELVLRKSTEYAKQRIVFDRPIGQNQGIQFPLANCKIELESAKLMTQKAGWLFDKTRNCAFEANMAAYLGAQAAFNAADRAIQTLGGMGFARDTDIERHWRDVRLFRTAPIPEEMTLNYVGQHVLNLPRSY